MDGLLYALYELEFYHVSPYLLALLGLLLIWLLYELQVRAGRIKKKDLWERSGIRLFLRVTPQHGHPCQACVETTRFVFLPSVVASKKFTPREFPCANPEGCRCVMVGLYGGWPEAERAYREAKKQDGTLRLSSEAMDDLVRGAQNARAGAASDLWSIRMLQAMRDEENDPHAALDSYRNIVERAKGARDIPLAASSYGRISDLLLLMGRREEAVAEIDKFLKAAEENEFGRNGLPAGFLERMKARRATLA